MPGSKVCCTPASMWRTPESSRFGVASSTLDLDENPGLGDQGYYYYLHVMSRALRAFGTASRMTRERFTIGGVNWPNWCRRSRTDRGSTENQIAGWKVSRLATAYAVRHSKKSWPRGDRIALGNGSGTQSSAGRIRLTVVFDSPSRTSGQHRSGRYGDAEERKMAPLAW